MSGEADKQAQYDAYLEAIEACRLSMERNGGERDAQRFAALVPQLEMLINENVRAMKMARDAVELQRRTNEIIDARQEAFMDRVQEVLKGYLTSGTAGMQGLSRMLVDALDRVRD